MLGTPWKYIVTNEEVLRRAGLKRDLIRSIEKRQLQFLGHILRALRLESECLLAKINGTGAQGRQWKLFTICDKRALTTAFIALLLQIR